MMRRKGRVDGNQKEVVDKLRRCGYSVAITSNMGEGFPDIVVGSGGNNYMFEIKDPAQPPSKRRLTDDEKDFKEKWRGQYDVILTYEDAIKIISLKNPPF